MSVMNDITPRCEILKKSTDDTPILGRLGVRVSRHGWTLPLVCTDELVTRFKKIYGPDWEPLADQYLYSYWVAHEAILDAGGERAGSRPPGEATRAYISLTDKHLVGNFDRGYGVDGNNKDLKKLDAVSLVFVWPLADIDRISVERRKGLFGTSDVQLMVIGGDSLLRAPSVKFYSHKKQYPQPFPGVSNSQAFGMVLADAVNRARGTTSAWVSSDESVAGIRVLGQEISFADGG